MKYLISVLLLLCGSAWAMPKYCGDDVGEMGYCDSKARVVWCEDNEIHVLKCKPGSVCAWNSDIGSFDCMSVNNSAACELIDSETGKSTIIPVTGMCDPQSNQVLWCEAGVKKSLMCKSGTTCGWNNEIEMFDCEKDTCKDIPTTGQCVEPNTLQWCNDGIVEDLPCADNELCSYSEQSKHSECASIDRIPDSSAKPETAPGAESSENGQGIVPPSYGLDDLVTPRTQQSDSEAGGGCSAAGQNGPGGLIVTLLGTLIILGFRRRQRAA